MGVHYYAKYDWKKQLDNHWIDYFYADCIINSQEKTRVLTQLNPYLAERAFIVDFSGKRYPANLNILSNGGITAMRPVTKSSQPFYIMLLDFNEKSCTFISFASERNQRYEGKLIISKIDENSSQSLDLDCQDSGCPDPLPSHNLKNCPGPGCP
jgi:hypothetical protein